MITRWYVGFQGDYEGRERAWHDIFTCPRFRHVFAMGYDPELHVYVVYEPSVYGTQIEVLAADERAVDILILHIAQTGCWLKVDPRQGRFLLGLWRFYCVPAVKHLLGVRSCALSPKGLYRHLVKQGAQPAFEVKKSGKFI